MEQEKTKYLIAGTLFSRLRDTPYRNITISQLCKEIPISRQTFYQHFSSKDDMLMWAVRTDCLENAVPIFKLHLKQQGPLGLLRYLENNAAVYRQLYLHDDGVLLNRCLLNAHREALGLKDTFSNPVTKKGQISLEVFERFACSGIVSVLCYWVSTDFSIPAETISKELYLMIEHPMSYVRDYYL